MIYLIAGTLQQANFWLRHNRLIARGSDKTVTVVTGPDSLRGLRIYEEDSVVRYGTWYERADHKEIDQVLERECHRG